MFSLIRIVFLSLRTLLNCLFFPFISIVLIMFTKIGYDIYGYFHPHTWILPKEFYFWLFGNAKVWEVTQVLTQGHFSNYCTYGAFIVLVLTSLSNLIGFTNLIIKIMRNNSGVRDAMNREEFYKDRIITACDELEKRYIAKYNKTPKLKFKLIDSSIKNAVIFTDNTVVLTTELLENTSDRELMGIIAHEWGHMHNGDTLYNQLNFANTLVSNNIEAGIVSQSIMMLFNITQCLPLGGLLSIFILIIFGPFLGVILVFGFLSWVLSLFEAMISRRQEYLADNFAYELDTGDGLLDFLYEDMKAQENFWKLSSIGGLMKSTLMSIYKTHPASEKRIKFMENKINRKNPEIVKQVYKDSKWL